ncbi:hypothetical protein ACQJBY_008408 [Aegilops geniculata]
MALLLLRGCLAPVNAAGPAFRPAETTGLLSYRRPSRFGAVVTSAAAASPSGGDGATAAVDAVLRGSEGSKAKARDYGGTNGAAVSGTARSTTIETTVERIIFDFRFLALLAVAGSLAGSLLCFLNGCVYIKEAYCVYWTSCAKGVHTGQMVLKVVEAIGSVRAVHQQRVQRSALRIRPGSAGIVAVWDVRSEGEAQVDEDHVSGRAQDEGGARHRDDPAGEDVRAEQDGEDHHGAGPAQLLRLHLPLLGLPLHPAQPPPARARGVGDAPLVAEPCHSHRGHGLVMYMYM